MHHITQINYSQTPPGIQIAWDDGFTGVLPYLLLRDSCPCAQCVDEWSRERKRGIPLPKAGRGYELKKMGYVGNYAIEFTWGDGHSTGIFTFEYLRNLAENAMNKSH